MLYFLSNKKRAGSDRGYFGYYSLIHWWNTEFTKAEKDRFQEAYESTHMLIPFDALFHGEEKPLMEYRSKKKSAIGFLSILLNSIVCTRGNEDISQKFINKCAQLIDARTDDVDLYFYYLSQIKLYGRLRQQNPIYDMPFRNACTSQVDIL